MEELIRKIFDLPYGERLVNVKQKPYPQVNAFLNEDSINVDVFYPGACKENFDVRIEDDLLIIEGIFKYEETEGIKAQFLDEFKFFDFERKFRLSKDIKKKDTVASYEGGVLNIKIPIDKKKEKERKMKVKVE